ncbi:MAG: hypothetical protein K6F58_04320 [Bacteroidales bacterium]|nr:hypothetical protein [Bacteroidales bacterium]
MKKFATVLLALAVSFSAMAQKPGKGTDHERFEAEKVAYITQQLSLTVEEAQAFWPVYNQAKQEERESRAVVRDAKKALREAFKEGKSDEEIRPLLDAYMKARAEKRDPMAEHSADFVKAVGETKTAKFYLAEDGFLYKSLREMSGSRPGQGKGPGFGRGQGGGQRL